MPTFIDPSSETSVTETESSDEDSPEALQQTILPPRNHAKAHTCPPKVPATQSSQLPVPPGPALKNGGMDVPTHSLRLAPKAEEVTPLSNTPSSSFSYTPPVATKLTQLFQTIKLEPIVIAHHTKLQKCMDDANVSFGVQWEIYRGLQNKQWDVQDVEMNIRRLRMDQDPVLKSADILPRVIHILTGKRVSSAVLADIG